MEEQDNIVVEELMSVEGIFGGIARDQLVAQGPHRRNGMLNERWDLTYSLMLQQTSLHPHL